VGAPRREDGTSAATKYDLFKIILTAKSNINVSTKDGQTPLHIAVMNAHTAWRQKEEESINRITDLINAGADIEAKDEAGRTPLHWAAWQAYSQMTSGLQASNSVVDILLKANANINARDNRGRTALHYAAEMGYQNIVSTLVKAGADVHIRDKENKTPEDLARIRSFVSIINSLKGIDVAATTTGAAKNNNIGGSEKYGDELLKAAWKGELNKVKELLAKNADIFYRDNDGFRAIDRARDNGHKEIVALLQQAEEKAKNKIN
jgi:ankyrin repeat protein